MITKEEYNKLKEIEKDFDRAVNSGYKMPTRPIWDGWVGEIYNKYLRPGEGINWNCGHCAFRAYQMVGQLYFEAKNKYENDNRNRGNKKNTDA